MNFLGDPLFNILGPVAADVDNPESLKVIEEAKAQYHLDKSLPERWARWAWDFVRGDFGVQFSSSGQPPVSDRAIENGGTPTWPPCQSAERDREWVPG